MIIVILKSKLESIDSILPLIQDIKVNSPDLKIEVFLTDTNHYRTIKSNIFLYDTLNKYTKIRVFKKNNFFLNKLRSIYFLFFFFFHNLIGSKFIHFGFFDFGIFKYLNIIFSKNFFRAQSNSYADKRRYYIKKIKIINEKLNSTSSKNILALNTEFENKINFKNKTVYFFLNPRLRKKWKDYVKSKTSYYINKFHPYANNKKIIFFAITSLHDQGFIKEGHSIEIFQNILNVLSKNFPEYIILIKPHPTTDLEKLDSLINKKKNVYVTFLHPSLISIRSDFFICDLFSTVTTDAHFLGLTTIEYSVYSDETLKLTKNKSVGSEFVDYFVNNDLIKLDELFKKDFIKKNKNEFTELSSSKELIDNLINYKR